MDTTNGLTMRCSEPASFPIAPWERNFTITLWVLSVHKRVEYLISRTGNFDYTFSRNDQLGKGDP